MGVTRPDLNGLIVRLSPKHQALYLIDNGYKRWIPDLATYNRIFSNWDANVASCVSDLSIDQITRGALDIPNFAELFKCPDSPKVYLLDWEVQKDKDTGEYKAVQVKRWIDSPGTAKYYNFDLNKTNPWVMSTAEVSIKYGDGTVISIPEAASKVQPYK